jgi:hypothetical protein
MSYLIDDPRFLSRVNTVPANTGYMNESIETVFGITKPTSAGYADLNNMVTSQISNNQQLLTSLKNYDINTMTNGYKCGINGGYAQLSNAAGWVGGG